MEDLWRVQNAGVDMEDLADDAEYKKFVKRFCEDEEKIHRRRLLYGEDPDPKPAKSSK